MDYSKIKKRTLWILGTVFLGAIGSGFWEGVLKPGLSWSATFVLDVATLGINGLRDGLYVDVAKGGYERAGLMVMALLYAIISGVIVGIGSRNFSFRKNPSGLVPKPEEGLSREKHRGWVRMAVGLSYAIVLIVQFFRTDYVIRATNHLDQMRRVVSPFITELEMRKLDSRIALMASRHDYFQIDNDLNLIAKKNGVRPPPFDVY